MSIWFAPFTLEEVNARGATCANGHLGMELIERLVGATSVAHPRADHRHALDRSPRATEVAPTVCVFSRSD
jgi:hypothetical protein